MKLLLLLLLSTTFVRAAELTLDRTHQVLGIGRVRYLVVENPNTLIKPGTYKVVFTYSNKLDQVTPEIIVEGRSGLRIHVVKNLKAGYALQGCIGMLREDYDQLLKTLKEDKENTITIL